MNLKLVTLARVYLVLFGLINLCQVCPLLGFYKTLISVPPYLSFVGWYLLFSSVYGLLPILSALVDYKKSWLVLASVFLVGLLLTASNVIMWVSNFHVMFTLLTSLAAIFAFHLAMENVALDIAAEILSLERSQF